MEAELTQPEVLRHLLLATVVVVVVAAASSLRRARAREGTPRVAHTERLRALPGYRRSVARRRGGLVVVALLLVAGVGLSGWVAARPMTVETRHSQLDNRDLVLCLDVSGSMRDENLAIIRTFRRLAADLQGERISLVMFDSVPLVIFPLTDDYDLVRGKLEEAQLSIEEAQGAEKPDIAAGASDITLGQSLVGDGLMGCAQQFTADAALAQLRAQQGDTSAPDTAQPEVQRSRVILLATDNEQLNWRGGALFTVAEGAERARSLGAMIVALDAGTKPGSYEARELADAAGRTGGATYPADIGDDGVESITAIVEGLASTVVEGDPVTSTFDEPRRGLDLLLPVMLLLGLAWAVVRP